MNKRKLRFKNSNFNKNLNKNNNKYFNQSLRQINKFKIIKVQKVIFQKLGKFI